MIRKKINACAPVLVAVMLTIGLSALPAGADDGWLNIYQTVRGGYVGAYVNLYDTVNNGGQFSGSAVAMGNFVGIESSCGDCPSVSGWISQFASHPSVRAQLDASNTINNGGTTALSALSAANAVTILRGSTP